MKLCESHRCSLEYGGDIRGRGHRSPSKTRFRRPQQRTGHGALRSVDTVACRMNYEAFELNRAMSRVRISKKTNKHPNKHTHLPPKMRHGMRCGQMSEKNTRAPESN